MAHAVARDVKRWLLVCLCALPATGCMTMLESMLGVDRQDEREERREAWEWQKVAQDRSNLCHGRPLEFHQTPQQWNRHAQDLRDREQARQVKEWQERQKRLADLDDDE